MKLGAEPWDALLRALCVTWRRSALSELSQSCVLGYQVLYQSTAAACKFLKTEEGGSCSKQGPPPAQGCANESPVIVPSARCGASSAQNWLCLKRTPKSYKLSCNVKPLLNSVCYFLAAYH